MNTSTQQKSYERYTSFFNKVCSSPLFLVFAALVSVYCVYAIVDFFGALGNIVFMLISGLNLLFAILSTIGVWMAFMGAKKGAISAGNFGLITSVAKFVRFITTFLTVIVTILSAAVVALIFTLKDKLVEILGSMEEAITEMGDMVSLGEDLTVTLSEFFATTKDYIENKSMMIMIACIAIVVFLIFALIRFAKGIKILNNAKNTYKTGAMKAAPTMFYPVLSFIVAAVGLYISFAVLSVSIFGIIYSLIIAVGGVLVLLNKNELASIYTAWQVEIGMISPAAAAANAPAAAPVVEEAPVAEEAPATTDAE